MRILTAGHYYHAYNQSAWGRLMFLGHDDYERFLGLLCAANGAGRFLSRDLSPVDAFRAERTEPLVEIVAYCLMPDHFHIAFRERSPGDGARFMQKLSTAYAMYYNRRHGHSGAIFRGTYRRERIEGDGSLRRLIRRIHLDPSRAADRGGGTAVDRASRWRYSSMRDYLGERRLERAILSFLPDEEPA